MLLSGIVSLVQLGFSGFAAAMAVLCYRLIHQEVARHEPKIEVINALKNFTRYTLFVSLVVILASLVDLSFGYATKQLAQKDAAEARKAMAASKQAQDCRESLTGLLGAEGTDRPPEELEEVARLVYSKCFAVMGDLEELK